MLEPPGHTMQLSLFTTLRSHDNTWASSIHRRSLCCAVESWLSGLRPFLCWQTEGSSAPCTLPLWMSYQPSLCRPMTQSCKCAGTSCTERCVLLFNTHTHRQRQNIEPLYYFDVFMVRGGRFLMSRSLCPWCLYSAVTWIFGVPSTSVSPLVRCQQCC